jgi:Nucleotide modification associated domain 1
MDKTLQQYNDAVADCSKIFLLKTKDYGTAWRVLRISSITDQIFIKAQRIRTIQQTGVQQVNEGIESEFIGIVNYAVIGLIQLQLSETDPMELSFDEAEKYFNDKVAEARKLMQKKNHDYGEAWRSMRVSSITDLILMKIYRIRQIEDNSGKTLISEGIDASYFDIINYALFALILLSE